jgi:glycosyltransferase involved in cell wall biosynthesis
LSRRPRKILIVTPTFSPDQSGYANAFGELKVVLESQLNFVSQVVTYGPSVNLTSMEADVFRHRTFKSRIPFLPLVVWRAIDTYQYYRLIRNRWGEFNPDFTLIETLENPVAIKWFLESLTAEQRSRVFIRIHGCNETEFFVFERIRRKRFFAAAKACLSLVNNLVFTSRFYSEFIKRNYFSENPLSYDAKNIFYLPNTWAVPKFTGSPLKSSKVSFLALGRMDKDGVLQKNFINLLRAWSVASRKCSSMATACTLNLIGCGSEKSKLIELAKELQIEEQVRFLGPFEHGQTIDMIRQADVIVLVSRFEACSMFAIESISLAKPLVASEGTGLGDIAIAGSNAMLVDPADPISIAEGLLLANSHDWIEKAGRDSLKLYEDEFSPVRLASRLKDFFNSFEA